MGEAPTPIRTLRTRQEVLDGQRLRRGWALLACAVIVPFLGLGAAYAGYLTVDTHPRQGWTLVAGGIAVFVVRMALWLS